MTDLVSLRVSEEAPNTVVVDAVGEIDLSNCGELDLILSNLNGARRVQVDMRLCTYFDSSCLAVLTRHARRLRDEGKTFVVTVNEQGRQVIALTKLGDLFGLADGGSEPDRAV